MKKPALNALFVNVQLQHHVNVNSSAQFGLLLTTWNIDVFPCLHHQMCYTVTVKSAFLTYPQICHRRRWCRLRPSVATSFSSCRTMRNPIATANCWLRHHGNRRHHWNRRHRGKYCWFPSHLHL